MLEKENRNIRRRMKSAHRYLFNSMENDPEVSGLGNSYTTEFRQYDPRLGRWKSLDPLMMKFPDQSPYNGFGNNPIFFVDPYGLEPSSGDDGGGDDDTDVGGKHYESRDEAMKATENGSVKHGDTYTTTDGAKMTYNSNNSTWQPTSDKSKSEETNNSSYNEMLDKLNTVSDVLTSIGISLSLFEKSQVNEFGWTDARGKWNSMEVLEKNSEGKYTKGVQGKRNSLNTARLKIKGVKAVGQKLYIVGQIHNMYTLIVASNNNDSKQVLKSSIDLGMGVYMAEGGIPGLVVGTTYYVVEYTIGWENVNIEVEKANSWIDENIIVPFEEAVSKWSSPSTWGVPTYGGN